MNSIFSKKLKDEKDTIDSIASLSHTKWNCKYHIVFTPKYRRKIFYYKFLTFLFYPVIINTILFELIYYLIKH